MRYYKSLYVKGLPNCGPSKFAIKKKLIFWVRGYVFGDLVSQGAAKLQAVKVGGQKKADILGSRLRFSRFCIVIAGPGFDTGRAGFWGAAALKPLELRRLIATFWKPLTLTILGLEAQGHGSTFRVHHALLKIAILLSIY